MIGRVQFVVLVAATTTMLTGSVLTGTVPTEARTRRSESGSTGGVPNLDVKGSCTDAQKFSTGDDKSTAFKGCLQDEMNAKSELGRRWSSFKPKDRTNCVEQARFPSPSYVEVLTCLEMDADAMRNTPRADGRSSPQIGGPVAPGLSPAPAPASSPSAPQ